MAGSRLKSCIPLPLDLDSLKETVESAKDLAIMKGVGMRFKQNYDRDALHFAPFVLIPSVFPKEEFIKAVELQPALNHLMHKVAYDDKFLSQTLKKTIQCDEFTKRLFEIYETMRQEGFAQEIGLGLLRSDYMMNSYSSEWAIKQIEINTIASSFGAVSTQLSEMHKFILTELGYQDVADCIPKNKALEDLSGAMIEAWRLYGVKKAVIMFIVEEVTYNICDQRFHHYEIQRQNPSVKVIRKTLSQVFKEGRLTEDKRLLVSNKEVAVVYYRCGYSPGQYPTENEWSARLMIERSLAIKSPSIQYHLAGTKKVQQELAKPGVLEYFFGEDRAKISQIRQIFAGLYDISLGTEEGEKTFKMVMRDPEGYVLKPQREGGGNNIYGKDIKPFLEKIRDSNERDAFIVMDRIWPPSTSNYLVRPKQDNPVFESCVSELGIFGCIIGSKNEIFLNKQGGHMLRTKLSCENEGGVSSGSGVLDSVLLVASEDCKVTDQ